MTTEPGAAAIDAAVGRRARPLSRYLLWLVALFMLAAAASVWSGWAQAERDALSAASDDAQYGARLAAKEISETVAVVRNSVEQVAGNPGIAQAFTSPQDCELAFTVSGGAGDGHLDVMSADGTVVCSSRPVTEAEARGYAAAPWLAAATLGPQLVAPVLDARTGRQAVIISTPIPGLGVTAAFLDLAALGTSAGTLFGGTRQLEFLVTTAGDAVILTRWPDGNRWAGAPTASTKFAPPTSAGDGQDVIGARRIYGQATVDGLGWRIRAGAARAPALAKAHQLAWRQSLVAGAGLLVGLLATLLVYRRITRPISQLRTAVRSAGNAAKAGSAANTGAAADVEGAPTADLTVGGPREVAELSVEFTNMLRAVDRELADRRRAEAHAYELERNYRQMFDTNPYPMYLFDTETLAILEANDAAVTYYGHPRATLLTMTVTGLCLPEDAAALTQAIAAAGPVERWRQQRQIRHDGVVAEVTITSHVLSWAGRTVRCAVIEDVTEREHLEQRLRQSQRLESLGQLAGGIAHDFNNLIGIVLGYATMAAGDVETAARTDPTWRPLHDDLLQIVAAGDRATALTRQLLSFARADVVADPQVLDLNNVVADIDRLLRRTLGEDISLLTRLADESWPVKADPGQLEQVLLNLAVNARDAMPNGGTLTIDTDPIDVDEHYAAQRPGLRVGRYMRLRVSDTGAGMSKATLDRAFEPFFTTKPKGQGTGLGLATIYGIITKAGGQAQIYSEPDHGTTVSALLPVTDEPAEIEPAAEQATHDGHGETILLVEDDDDLRTITERILTRHGYAVVAAAEAAQAVRVAAAYPSIDVLLTDVVLPETDGHALAGELQEIHPAMSVIYMSGYTETILAARSTLPGGVTLLNKPVTADQLLTAVTRCVHTRASAVPTER